MYNGRVVQCTFSFDGGTIWVSKKDFQGGGVTTLILLMGAKIGVGKPHNIEIHGSVTASRNFQQMENTPRVRYGIVDGWLSQ